MDNLNFQDKAVATIERRRNLIDDLSFNNYFHIEHYRKGALLDIISSKNLVTNEGKNSILDIMFHAATQITTWYIGLINNSGYSAVAAADTMSSHAGWTELTSYDESVRQTWTEAAASSQSITSSSVATFTISATVAARGMFLVSNSTKGGTTGTLWAATLFSSALNLVDDDTLRVTYTVNAS